MAAGLNVAQALARCLARTSRLDMSGSTAVSGLIEAVIVCLPARRQWNASEERRNSGSS